MRKHTLSIAAGAAIAFLLSFAPLAPAIAQQAMVLFGSVSGGGIVPVAGSSAGAMNVTVASGQAPVLLSSSVTQVCTAADTNETDLWNYQMPASTLATNGQTLRFTVMGTYGATANNKTLKLYLGTTSYQTDTSSSNNGQWRFQGIIVRTGAATQQALQWGSISGGTFRGGSLSALTETLANVLTVKVTGTNGTAAANDICFKAGILEILK